MAAIGIFALVEGRAAAVDQAGDVAAPPRPTDARDLFALDVHVGGNTPFGYFGLALDVTPLRWLSIELGVGHLGHGDANQLGLAVVPRVRVLSGARWAIDLGAGFSRGSHTWWSDDYERANIWEGAYRLDVQAGGDLRVWTKLRLRIYGGAGRILGPPDAHFGFDNFGPEGNLVPYVGASVGYALERYPNERPPVIGRWYGYQLLAFDAAAALVLAARVDDARNGARPEGIGAAAVLFGLSAPIIHLEHQRPRAAVISAVARLAVIGAALAQQAEITESNRPHYTVIVAAGVVVALVDALLAREPASPEAP